MLNGKTDQTPTDLAIRIKTARKEARLSQLDLANGIGLSDKSISAYEQGRSVPPVSKLKQIADITKHPLSYFTNAVTDYDTLDSILQSIEQDLQEIRKLVKK